MTELAERVRLFRAPLKEVANRLTGLPRGAYGMTLAHIGVGVFVLGACVETGWRVEAAQALKLGDSVQVGAYSLSLTDVTQAEGPNYSAERATVRIKGPAGDSVLYPERRFYPANRQTVSQVAIETHGPSDLYVVFGERREGTGAGEPSWLVRAYWNPWARMIFGGPLLMALGGLVSLSDRRLRMAAGARARAAAAAGAKA